MKKALVFLSICFLQAGMVFSQSVTTLDDAIKNAGSVLGFRIPANTNVMVLHFQSPTADLSDYIVKRLTVALKGDNFLKIVEERNRPSL
ncbi:MAG: hypothetical protein LBT68_06195, partial [Spirochaetales bacterium]|nr:hypothetical protein [Spirochaetales bacterium]